MKLSANMIAAMVNTIDVSARFHPNLDSSGATNTLHPYSVPSARFIDRPPTTRHQRLMFECILDSVPHALNPPDLSWDMSDPLLDWRKEFPVLDKTVYLISHSLGAMPRRTRDRLTNTPIPGPHDPYAP